MKYNEEVASQMLLHDDNTKTRGHNKKLKRQSRLNIRKYAFKNRVVDPWNNFPESVVNAKTLVEF